MKALTLWQPWASLVALGEKQVETRVWKTRYRGEIAIHSAAHPPPKGLGASSRSGEFRNELADAFNCRLDHVEYSVSSLSYGKVLCIVKLVAIEETQAVRDTLGTRELIFGNYEDGRYAWFMEMVEVFDRPIPAKGNRLLWNWNR